MKNQYYVLWNNITRGFGTECDQVALFRSSEYTHLFGTSMPRKGNKEIEGLLKISYQKRTIYRKYISSNIPDEASDIVLNYRSLAELGINPNTAENDLYLLDVEPANAWGYLWNNSYVHIRKPFQWAIYGLLMTIGFGVVSIILEVMSLCR